jgi:hypothetical protein
MTNNLDSVFDELKKILGQYSPPLIERRGNTPGKRNYHLWSEKETEIAGRKRKEVYFAGLIIQKGYVGLYYMPIYTDTTLEKVFGKELLSTLKGKSCFYIKTLEGPILSQIKKALKKGFELYKQRGWV